MRRITFLLFFLLFTFSISDAQETTRLVTITEGSPNNAAGLGQTFFGKVLDDGNLYFRGSSNGLRDALWFTNGTISGTSKLIEESNDFGGNWGQVRMLDEGFLFLENDEWNIYSVETNSIELLSNLPNERIFDINKLSDGSYIFSTEREEDVILFTGDASLTEITEIGNFHPDEYTALMTSGPEGAIVFNSNPFQEEFSGIYLKSTGEIMSIEDYFSSLSLTISDFSYGYIFDEFLVVSYRDSDNFSKNSIINMTDNSIADFSYIWEPIEYHQYGDELLIITQREVISINKNDLSHTVLFDNVFPFSVSELFEDKLILIGRGEGFTENLVEVNLTDKTSRFLENGITGSSFYNCKMKSYKGEFYYLSEDSHQLLMKYDFDNNTSVVVDTLSVNTGATVVHALEVVNDELVISKRIDFLQHEMYALGDGLSSNVAYLNINKVDVYPSVSSSTITLKIDPLVISKQYELFIYDMNGNLVCRQKLVADKLDISSIPTSKYVGLIKSETQIYRFDFLKI